MFRAPLIVAGFTLCCMGCGGAPASKPAGPAAPPPAAEAAAPAAEKPVSPEGPAAAPAGDVQVKLLDYEGVQALVGSHKGKIVVMDCWSLSCAPCVKEFPNLVALHRELGAEKVACISLSFDNEGIKPLDKVQQDVHAFLAEKGATFDNVVTQEENEEVYKKLDLAAVPAVYVYDRAGALRKRFDNETPGSKEFTYADVRALVDELLAENR